MAVACLGSQNLAKDGQGDPDLLPPHRTCTFHSTLPLQSLLTRADPSDQDQDSQSLGSIRLTLVSERKGVGREKGTWNNVSLETTSGRPKEH